MLDFFIRTLGIFCGVMLGSYLFHYEIKPILTPKEESLQELKLKQKDIEDKVLSLEKEAQIKHGQL